MIFLPTSGAKGNSIAFNIVVDIAVAITSIPVISKIFIDLGIINTRFAKIVLSTATIQDVILWVALAIATGMVSSEVTSTYNIILTVLAPVAFFGFALWIMLGLIRISNDLKINFLIKSSVFGYALFICFIFAAIASTLNINVVFGAFLAGIIIGVMPNEQFGTGKSHIKEISRGCILLGEKLGNINPKNPR
jgi:Kef-type K+ transport system membrane component KefB